MAHVVIALAAVAAIAASTAADRAHANGCGVPVVAPSTYQVSTEAQLRLLPSCDLTWTVLQTADIDVSSGGAWTPIGTGWSTGFSGTYDGQGHEITGLTLTPNGTQYSGLFGSIWNGTVRNLTVSGRLQASGEVYVGLVTGLLNGNTGGILQNVHARGTVTATSVSARVGGLVGETRGRGISDSSARVQVSGASYVGGITGVLAGVPVLRSHGVGDVTATHASTGRAGGIVGSGSSVGGVAASVVDSYATGAVSGSALGGGTYGANGGIGGIVGTSGSALEITRSYASGPITRTSGNGNGFGGVLGADATTVTSAGQRILGLPPAVRTILTGAVWNSTTVGTLGALSGLGVARTSAQMRSIETFTALGWGIVPTGQAAGSNVWGICHALNDGFPYLRWENPAAACPPQPSSDSAGAGGAGAGGAPGSTPTSSVTIGTVKSSTMQITVPATVPGPGVITVVGSTPSSALGTSQTARAAATTRICTAKKTTKTKGTVTITCPLTTRARTARNTRSLVVSIVATFTPTGGTTSQTTKRAMLPRTGRSAAVAVTG